MTKPLTVEDRAIHQLRFRHDLKSPRVRNLRTTLPHRKCTITRPNLNDTVHKLERLENKHGLNRKNRIKRQILKYKKLDNDKILKANPSINIYK